MPKANSGAAVAAPAAPPPPAQPAAAPPAVQPAVPPAAPPPAAPAPPAAAMPMSPPPAGPSDLQNLAAAVTPNTTPTGGNFDFAATVGAADYSGVSSEGGIQPLLPEDLVYESCVVECKGDVSSAGNPMLSVKLKTVFPKEYAGVTLYDNIVVTGDNPWKFKSFFTACELADPTGARCIAKSPNDFVDYVVRHGIQHDEYAGKKKNKINGGYVAGFQFQE